MLIESTETSQKMQAAISASFSSFVGSAKGEVDVEALNDLSNLRVKAIAIGGDSEGTIDMIGETDLQKIAERMSKSTDIRAGKPLSYVVKNVANNEIVSVKLATEYDVTNCRPLYSGGGEIFTYLALQQGNVGINTPVETLRADVDGMNGPDIIFNHKQGALNQVKVAFNSGSGSFSFATDPVAHPATVDNWGDYTATVADFNGDGKADLVWNEIKADVNTVYLALSTGSGSFDFKDAVSREGVWGNYQPVQVGDINSDGKDDLVWNETVTGLKRTYVAWGASQVDMEGMAVWDYPTNRLNAKLFIGNFDSNSSDDLMWNNFADKPSIRVAMSNGDGSFKADTEYNFPAGFSPYTFNIGDINGDGLTDLVYVRPKIGNEEGHPIHVRLADGAGYFTALLNWYTHELIKSPFHVKIGDTDNDGRDDVLLYQVSDDKQDLTVHLGHGFADGTVNFHAQDTAKIATPGDHWDKFEKIFMEDVNEDQREDLVLINPTGNAQIYVALSK